MQEDSRELRSHAGNRSSRPQPSDDPQPRGRGLMQQCAFAVDGGLLIHGNPEVGRVAAQRFAKESGRRYADYGEGMAFHHDGRTEHRRVAAVSESPGMMAEY